ncbi:MAG: hypothetical protein AAGG75_16325 [Bacteroidota bacterium]
MFSTFAVYRPSSTKAPKVPTVLQVRRLPSTVNQSTEGALPSTQSAKGAQSEKK